MMLANRRCVSSTSDRHPRDARAMSAVLPIASKFVQGGYTALSAKRRRSRSSKQHRYSITSSARASSVDAAL